MVLKSNTVIISEDQILEALTRYLRDTPFKYDISYIEITDVTENEDGLRLELELYDES